MRIPVCLEVTVHVERWRETWREDVRGVGPYLRDTFLRDADRIVDLRGKIFLLDQRMLVWEPASHNTLVLDLLVVVDTVAWRDRYATSCEDAVPHYLGQVAAASYGITQAGGTVIVRPASGR